MSGTFDATLIEETVQEIVVDKYVCCSLLTVLVYDTGTISAFSWLVVVSLTFNIVISLDKEVLELLRAY